MTDTDKAKKKARILSLMYGYPSAKSQISDGVVNSYLMAVEQRSLEAVTRACERFLRGEVQGHDNAFLPTAAELAAQATSWDYILGMITADRELNRLVAYRQGELPPPGMEPGGLASIEVAGRRMDVRTWTQGEQDEAVRTGKVPKSVLDRQNAVRRIDG